MEQEARTLTEEQRMLVEDNMKLVPYMLNKCEVPYWMLRSEEDDLMQIGYLALCMAALSYDAECGKFSTYACTAIKNAIIKEIDKETSKSKISVADEIAYSYLCDEPDPNSLEDTCATRFFLEEVADTRTKSRMENRNIQILFTNLVGYTTKEISKANGLSLLTVQRSIRRARQQIRMEYQQFEGRLRA